MRALDTGSHIEKARKTGYRGIRRSAQRTNILEVVAHDQHPHHLQHLRYLYAGPRREFRLPKSAAEKYGIPHSSLCRYIHELEAGGWIEVRSMKLLRKPNEYRFALKWKGLSPSS